MSQYDIYREKFQEAFNSVKLNAGSQIQTHNLSLSNSSKEVYVADVNKLFKFLVLNENNGINDKIKQKLETVYKILNKSETNTE
jgi:hypothetical protein